jgi:phosphopantothenoylcysteine decarboxylase/phosphopantothenate--cysteine ligase
MDHHRQRRVLVTAGPTHEPIDAVRYIANRSSGRMGIAVAEASTDRGWPTTLLLGPTPLEPRPSAPTPQGHSRRAVHRFRTTDDLRALLREHWPSHDVLIMAAAVADYRPAAPGSGKRKRGSERWTLELEPTPDLVAELAAASRADQTIVGFALEPAERLERSGREKLAAKGLAAIVANPIETMDAREIEATLLLRDGRTLRPAEGPLTKERFASWLLDQLDEL